MSEKCGAFLICQNMSNSLTMSLSRSVKNMWGKAMLCLCCSVQREAEHIKYALYLLFQIPLRALHVLSPFCSKNRDESPYVSSLCLVKASSWQRNACSSFRFQKLYSASIWQNSGPEPLSKALFLVAMFSASLPSKWTAWLSISALSLLFQITSLLGYILNFCSAPSKESNYNSMSASALCPQIAKLGSDVWSLVLSAKIESR